MTHKITNQHGKYIEDKDIIKEIKYMLDRGFNYTYIEGKKVSVYSDKRFDDERETVIEVESL